MSLKNEGLHHRSVVSRPGLVKDSSLCCCPLVPADLPESAAVRGSESDSGGLCGRSFLCRDKEGRVKMGLLPQTLGQLMASAGVSLRQKWPRVVYRWGGPRGSSVAFA